MTLSKEQKIINFEKLKRDIEASKEAIEFNKMNPYDLKQYELKQILINTGQLKQELEILENEFRSAIRKSR